MHNVTNDYFIIAVFSFNEVSTFSISIQATHYIKTTNQMSWTIAA